jgi:hypothetical protein
MVPVGERSGVQSYCNFIGPAVTVNPYLRQVSVHHVLDAPANFGREAFPSQGIVLLLTHAPVQPSNTGPSRRRTLSGALGPVHYFIRNTVRLALVRIAGSIHRLRLGMYGYATEVMTKTRRWGVRAKCDASGIRLEQPSHGTL